MTDKTKKTIRTAGLCAVAVGTVAVIGSAFCSGVMIAVVVGVYGIAIAAAVCVLIVVCVVIHIYTSPCICVLIAFR